MRELLAPGAAATPAVVGPGGAAASADEVESDVGASHASSPRISEVVVLVDRSLNCAEAVSFVDRGRMPDCLTRYAGSPDRADVDIAAAAPTHHRSPQWCVDHCYLAAPTFAQVAGLPDGCE